MSNSFIENDVYKSAENSSGGVQSIVAGNNIAVDSSDPENPVVSTVNDGIVKGILVQPGLHIDSTNPEFPVLSLENPSGATEFGFASINLAACRQALAVPGVNNAGALLATFFQSTTTFTVTNLSCFVKQIASGGFTTLGVYDQSGNLLAKTNPFFANTQGLATRPITTDGAGNPMNSLELSVGVGYYLAIHCTQTANGSQYFAYDAGTTFGATPFIGWGRDNIGTLPNSLSGGSESSIRFYIGAIS